MAKNGHIEVAQAYVTIIPSLQGAQKKIASELDPASEKAGNSAGKKLGDGLSNGSKKGISKLTDDISKKLSKSFSNGSIGKSFSSSFDDMALNVGAKMESIGLKVRDVGSRLKSAFTPPELNDLGQKVSGEFSKVGSAVGTVAGKIAGVFGGVKLAVGEHVGGAVEKATSLFKGLGDKVGPVLSKVGEGASKAFAKVGKAAGVASVAVGAAFALVGKSAIDSYADFEQLEGGIRKLFGEESSKVVAANAARAYQTAGMSANQYMEQATTFSAALIKGLNGDTAEAARLTDVAIRAMSDNVNTFGSDAQSVQDAFNGFAKQNYTMLDNLKLGYAGTKQGMVDLVKDSGVLGDAAADLTAKNLDEKVSFAQIVEAIEAVQVQQHIAGTTAKEAGTTISGSVGMAKAAWQNLLTEFGKSDGQIEARVGELVTTVFGDGTEANLGVFGNVLPVAVNVAKGIIKSLPAAVQSIGTALRTQLMPMLDEVTGGAASRVVGVLEPMATRLGKVFTDFGSRMAPLAPIVAQIASKLGGFLAVAINAVIGAFEILMPVVADIAAAVLPALSAAIDVVVPIVAGIIDAVGRFASTLISHLRPAINAIGPILAALGNVILQVGSWIGEHVMPVAGDLAELFAGALGDAISVVAEALAGLLDFLSPVGDAIGAVGDAIGNAWDFITGRTEESASKVERSVSTHTAAATSAATSRSQQLVANVGSNWQSLAAQTDSSYAQVSASVASKMGEAQSSATAAAGGAASSVGMSWEQLLAQTQSSYGSMSAAVDSGMAGIADSATANADSVVAGVNGSWSRLDTQTGVSFGGMQASVQSSLAAAQGAANNSAKAMQSSMVAAFKSIQSAATSSFQGVRSTITSQLGNVVSTARSMASQLTNALNFRALASSVVSTFTSMRSGIASQMSSSANAVTSGASAVVSAFSNMRNGITSQMSGSANAVTSGVSSIKSSFDGLKGAASGAMSAAVKSVNDGVSAMRKAMSTHISMPTFDTVYIRLPHFKMRGTFNAEKGTVPSVSVDWYGKGGMVENATLIGAGERGTEFIWPSYSPYLERYADALADSMGGDGADARAIIAWLQRNLGPIINANTFDMSRREMAREVRRMAYA